MTTNNINRSDLPRIYDIVQNAMTLYPKELVIAALRDFFSTDSFYSYRHDPWGFPQTPDLTGVPLNAGLQDSITTRLFIGEAYRFDTNYFPALLVRHGGSTSVPISFNREAYCIQWGNMVFQDGYNIKTFPVPEHFILAGAWEGTINIDVRAKDLRTRDDLVDLVGLNFVDVAFNDLVKSGLAIKGVSSGAPSEVQDRNDWIYQQTVSLTVRSEWRRQLPIANIIDVIRFSIDFRRFDPPPDGPVAANLSIVSNKTIMDLINAL